MTRSEGRRPGAAAGLNSAVGPWRSLCLLQLLLLLHAPAPFSTIRADFKTLVLTNCFLQSLNKNFSRSLLEEALLARLTQPSPLRPRALCGAQGQTGMQPPWGVLGCRLEQGMLQGPHFPHGMGSSLRGRLLSRVESLLLDSLLAEQQ